MKPSPPPRPIAVRRLHPAARLLGTGGVAAVAVVFVYLAVRPSPNLREMAWLPARLGAWADVHGVLRNTVAFFPFGLAVFGLVGRRALHLLALGLFAIGIETAQIWIPGRCFDPWDIAASLAGIVPAWLLVTLLARLRCASRLATPGAAP